MTNLPATYVEAEVIAAVGQWVEVVQDKMTSPASREWLESTLRQFLQQGLIETLQIVESAEAGDEIAHAALTRVYHEMLDRGEMPGATLRSYKARADLLPVARRKAGSHAWFDDWRRNCGIAVLVYLTKERFGLHPTRNREQRRKRRPSACSVVSAALGRHTNVTEKRVENIWAGLKWQVTAYAISQKMSPSIMPN